MPERSPSPTPLPWVHPDRLDRLSATGGPATTAPPAPRADVERVLAKALSTGRLPRIPRNPEHRNIVLAVLCGGLLRRHAYAEAELNDYLEAQLGTMNADVDHVTCRRLLVDVGFLKRDRAGTRYFLNHQQVRATLSEDTAVTAGELVRRALARRR